MAMSRKMQKVYDLAMAFDKSLLATDKMFDRYVVIQHQDGTTLNFSHASCRRVIDPRFLDDQEKSALEFWKRLDDAIDHPKFPDPEPSFDGEEFPQIQRSEIGWLIVFSEHNGTHVFACGDLANYAQYERIYEIEEFPIEDET